MKNIEDIIIEAVDNRIKQISKNVNKCDKTYYGIIGEVLEKSVVVNISGIDYKAYTTRGMFVQVGDIAIINAPNGDFSNLYVNCVLGSSTNISDGDLKDVIRKINEHTESIRLIDNEISNLSEARALSDIGLSDADMSATDFGSNVLKILNAMPQYKKLKFWVWNGFPNLRASITKEAVVKSDDYMLIIEKGSATNVANKVIIQPNTTSGIVKEQWGYYDNAWGGFREVATTDKIDISLPLNSGFTLDGGKECRITKVNNYVRIGISVGRSGTSVDFGAISSLPVGYRPPYTVNGNCRLYAPNGKSFLMGYIEISVSGTITISCDKMIDSTIASSVTKAWGHVEFYVD